jgi:hypothetical protein
MYKILIRRGNSTKPIYYYYQVSETDEQGVVSLVDYETDDINKLTDTVQELIELFKLSDIKPVKELDVEVLLSIVDE